MNFQNQLEYGHHFNIDILDAVPSFTGLDREILKQHIVFRCALKYPLYSEPMTMKAAIGHWFSYMSYGIEKMIALSAKTYDPLENYNKVENETIWRHGTDADTGTITDERTITDTGSITDEGGSNTEQKVSAYNSSDYSPDRTADVTNGNERTLDTERSDNNTRTLGNTKTLQHDERNKRETHGNIGTVTAQDMFNQEIDVLDRFNPYDWIVDKLEDDLFLAIW